MLNRVAKHNYIIESTKNTLSIVMGYMHAGNVNTKPLSYVMSLTADPPQSLILLRKEDQ